MYVWLRILASAVEVDERALRPRIGPVHGRVARYWRSARIPNVHYLCKRPTILRRPSPGRCHQLGNSSRPSSALRLVQKRLRLPRLKAAKCRSKTVVSSIHRNVPGVGHRRVGPDAACNDDCRSDKRSGLRLCLRARRIESMVKISATKLASAWVDTPFRTWSGARISGDDRRGGEGCLRCRRRRGPGNCRRAPAIRACCACVNVIARVGDRQCAHRDDAAGADRYRERLHAPTKTVEVHWLHHFLLTSWLQVREPFPDPGCWRRVRRGMIA
jgi:hypothetical protein